MALEPTEAELIREAIDSRLLDVHTALPGIVEKYDPTTQTADVRLAVKRALDSSSGNTEHEDIPVIPNVPVGWFASGGFAMQLPISVGDGVWLMFSEAAWGGFRSSGQASEPVDLSRFSLSYPVAIPICRPVTKTLTPLSANEGALDVPTGKTFRVGGPSAGYVALADKIANDLVTWIKTGVAPPGGGTVTYATPAPSVAATKLKAE